MSPGGGVQVRDLSLRLGQFSLRRLDLDLEDGEILVLLGPNGAGKSVTLEAIAGFHRAETGRITVRGREITRMAPERRNIGLLFQNFALFPHLTVAQNIGFGRRASGRRIAELLDDFGISHLAQRYPLDLSPGEKQRTALARAMASEPDLFLLDEPFSALDPHTRDQLRDELEQVLRRNRIPAIVVTHDHADALALADKMVLLRDGAVVQKGATAEVFRRPTNRFVARFLGFENIVPAQAQDGMGGALAVRIGGQLLYAGGDGTARPLTPDVLVALRAEDIDLQPFDGSPLQPSAAGNRFVARVTSLRATGMLCSVMLDCGLRACLMTRRARDLGLAPGGTIAVAIDPAALHLMAAPDGALAEARAEVSRGFPG